MFPCGYVSKNYLMRIRTDMGTVEYMLCSDVKFIIVSEKIVRQIMKEEHLVVKVKRTAKYNSYAGEVTPSVPNKYRGGFFFRRA